MFWKYALHFIEEAYRPENVQVIVIQFVQPEDAKSVTHRMRSFRQRRAAIRDGMRCVVRLHDVIHEHLFGGGGLEIHNKINRFTEHYAKKTCNPIRN